MISSLISDYFRELTCWSYKHATSIESKRYYRDGITIADWTLATSSNDSNDFYVLIGTSNYYLEIYEGKSINKEPVFTTLVRYPSKIFATRTDKYFLLTNNGTVHIISRTMNAEQRTEFSINKHAQLKIPCTMLLGTIITLNSSEYLVVVADNGQSIGILNLENTFYENIQIPAKLNSILSDQMLNIVTLHCQDESLITLDIKLNTQTNNLSIEANSLEKILKFSLKNNVLATFHSQTHQVLVRSLTSDSPMSKIEFENQCEHICLNDSGEYLFTIIKPRMLYLHRVKDGCQLAKLFLVDLVRSLQADNDFVVMGMSDRRLLTLMIADPQDPKVAEKIKALPSR